MTAHSANAVTEPWLSPIDAQALGRLRWRCRRGMLENDLLLERFFARYGDSLTSAQAEGLLALMELPDNDLLDVLLARCEPAGELARRDDVTEIVCMLRSPMPTALSPSRSERSAFPHQKERP